jgi:dephospho-CoA kinase
MNNMEKYILKVGVTGGIGSGKTEVCKILERSGERVLYADQIAKEITEKNEDVKKEIKKIFGKEVFNQNNDLDRKKIADIVFKNKSLKEKLNNIIHPLVFERIDEEIQNLNPDLDLIFIEAALIFESGMEEGLDYIVVVDSDEKYRIQRIQERDKKDISQIRNIFKSQMSTEEKIKRADFIIKNNGTFDELGRAVFFIRDLLLTLSK